MISTAPSRRSVGIPSTAPAQSAPAPEPKAGKPRRRFATIALVVALVAALAGPAAYAAVQLPDPDTSWYVGHEQDSSYTIGGVGENPRAKLLGLAKLVNEQGVSFEGKTIALGSDVNFYGATIAPIGSDDNPFLGTFDGGGHSIESFVMEPAEGDANYVGFIGYAGVGSHIEDLVIGKNASINIARAAESTEVVHHVGLVAGVSYGTIANCENRGSITIDTAVLQQSKESPWVIRNVGGVAGGCVFDLTGCTNSGDLTLNATSSPVEEYESDYLITNVGGVVGILGDEDDLGLVDAAKPSTPEQHGLIADCANSGKLTIDTPSTSGKDRFGQVKFVYSQNIGGVVGYSRGSVLRCTNGGNTRDAGYVRAEHASTCGGIVGSLRSTTASNVDSPTRDDGEPTDPIVCADCTNSGDVYGHAGVGGICGGTGTYAEVTGCLNINKTNAFGNEIPTYIIATRWNKPAPSGIVGRAHSTVTYCANFANVASGTYQDNGEADRKFNIGSGYYASGIVGMLSFYEASDESGARYRSSPLPEIYGCYNAGSIFAQSGMRQRGIVGENNGYVHDNVLLKGTVDNDKIVYGDDPDADTEASGQCGHNVVMASAATEDMASMRGFEAVQWLNTQGYLNGWTRYWAVSTDGQNKGYPVLSRQLADDAASLSAATAALEHNAEYTGAESIPHLSAKLGSATLYQNVDFYVVPQAGAIEVTQDAPYRASIVGIGHYKGALSGVAPYGIDKGDLANCSVILDTKKFNWDPQTPTQDDLIVITGAGTLVDPSEYTFSYEGECVNKGFYLVTVTAVDTSSHFYGTATGTYVITAADLMRDVEYSTISYLGTDYEWKGSTEEGGKSDNPDAELPYAGGVQVRPTVGPITYLGHTLVEGRDYRVVYGNPQTDDEDEKEGDKEHGGDLSNDSENLGQAGGTTVGCVTVRLITNTNFKNYANMFFKITDFGAIDLSRLEVVAPEQLYDGTAHEPVKLMAGAAELRVGEDYDIVYANNTRVGTASFTATGKGAYTGEASGTFEIVEGELYTIEYEYAGAGTAASPYAATVVGATYHGSADTYDLFIPDTVEHDGHTYAVTKIGAKAFGGSGRTDFEDGDSGTTLKSSKLKVGTVSIPASVTEIGAYAFGSAANGVATNVTQVTLREGSQLATIGDGAFQNARYLKSMTLPASLETIGKEAFRECKGLSELTFETTSATSPASIHARAFVNTERVTIRGTEQATAVKALATNNSSGSTGKNGGKKFTFEAIAAQLSAAQIAPVPDQVYSGLPIRPELEVTLGGQGLIAGTNYLVDFANNTEIGTATYTITGTGGYSGTRSGTFQIVARDLADADVAVEPEHAYTGAPIAVAPKLTYDDDLMREGRDYTVAYADADGVAVEVPVEQGTYTATFTGMGHYTGTATATFTVANLDERAATEAEAAIDALPAPADVAHSDGDAIAAARAAYEALSDAQKALVSADALAKLEADEAALDSLAADVMRICGESYANETAAAISAETFPEGSDWVIIARDDDFADALGATGLAGALDAPILLTNRFELSAAAASEISRLGAKHAYVIGGTGAIKSEVDTGLAALGVAVEPRIWGENSYDTSLACAQAIEKVTGERADTVIIAMSTNFQDALSMSPYAYKYKVPVVLQNWGATSADRGFTAEAATWLTGRSVLVAGGAGAVSDASVAPYKLVERLWGDSGYDTSLAIANWMVEQGYLGADMVVVACGAQAPKGVDALAGAALAGKAGAPMLLVNSNTAMESANTVTVDEFVAQHASVIKRVRVLGGAYVVPQALYDRIEALVS